VLNVECTRCARTGLSRPKADRGIRPQGQYAVITRQGLIEMAQEIRTAAKKCRAPAWHLSASRTTKTAQTSGPISSSLGLTGRRNDPPFFRSWGRPGKRWGKAREPLGVATPAARLSSCGLTGLLNPPSIWHKIISVVLHELLQLCFFHCPSEPLCVAFDWSRMVPIYRLLVLMRSHRIMIRAS
jgi:hypothetical protein